MAVIICLPVPMGSLERLYEANDRERTNWRGLRATG
jgi:hypothetical protein